MESSFEGTAASVSAPVSGAMTGDMSAPDQGFEGETVFESPVQTEAVFDQVVVSEEFAGETPADDSRQIMDIPGTAHDKLAAMVEMDEEPEDEASAVSSEVSTENNETRSSSRQEIAVQPELSPEQQIMMLQAEAIKLLAKALSEGKNNVDKQELEELIRKLKKLLEEGQSADKGKDKKESKTGMVISTTLSLLGLMFALSEKAINEVEEEASKN